MITLAVYITLVPVAVLLLGVGLTTNRRSHVLLGTLAMAVAIAALGELLQEELNPHTATSPTELETRQ